MPRLLNVPLKPPGRGRADEERIVSESPASRRKGRSDHRIIPDTSLGASPIAPGLSPRSNRANPLVRSLGSARSPMPRALRIVVADEVPTVRLGLSVLLNRQPGFKVCGEAHNCASLLKSVSSSKPDLVVTDIFLREPSGLALIGVIRNQHAGTKVLVHTGFEEVLFAERAVRAGAAGYVMKREPMATVVKAVRHVLKGGIFVTARAMGKLLHQRSGQNGSRLQPLSDREMEVLRSMGEGFTSREIADAMHVSIKTVDAHREHIKAKLGLAGRSELLRLAIQWAQGARG
jgi:DNA-binding NarL/FixJ family response regulator